ncbi:ABC transporter permease [Ancylobacter oerskovii]|uniref:Autoinducer 2 import system permease protein LsrC n=1 Tax=Ancylobacter oerskovii TaxID=459519 RepID=A0ABW4YWD9_9HYPH|nr:ABC transporter permease [Ancylobacter oerskovii]MBS7544163.1 ABC transporter permease [Ancylobacter oerskovii]
MIATILKRRETMLALAILALIALVQTRFAGFARPGNLAAIFNDSAVLIILALGQMAVILTRCIDLSVAATLAFTGMVAALVNAAAPGLPIGAVLLIAVGLGTAMGAVNGLLVWRFALPPIVVTLGTMTMYRGAIFLLSGGEWVNSHQMSEAFKALPRSLVLDLPVLSWMAILVIALFVLMIGRTTLGRAFYAVGGNEHAAIYAGISVGGTRFVAFTLNGALAGLCGYLWVSRYAVAYTEVAQGFELDVIAACVIGGISIAGGIGTVGGAVLGALFLGVIKNALPVAGVSPFWQMAISGIAILLAVAFNARSEQRKGRIILKSAEQAHAAPAPATGASA